MRSQGTAESLCPLRCASIISQTIDQDDWSELGEMTPG